MIEIGNNFRKRYASAVKKARAERIRCVYLDPGIWYVARRAPGHGQYLVRFFDTPDPEKVTAVCSTIYNQACPSSLGKKACVHIALAHERAIRDGRKKQRKAA